MGGVMSRTRVNHPIFASLYVRMSEAMEKSGATDHRRRLLEGLSGRVIEVGAGNGLNFPYYPDEVTRVLAVEPERILREIAQDKAGEARVPIDVVDGVAEELPAEDGSFDAAVVSLVLCCVRDQKRALAELRRVVKPGGELRFFEHVRAETSGLRRVQRLLDMGIWPTLCGGCHTSRDSASAIEAAGFEIQRLEKLRFPDIPVATPTSPHVLGSAARK
jgi:ubiquinone/menaquinone biosynthesis C-methylase UbiE